MKKIIAFLKNKRKNFEESATKIRRHAVDIENEAESLGIEIRQLENENFYKLTTTVYHKMHFKCLKPKSGTLFKFEIDYPETYKKDDSMNEISPNGFAIKIKSLITMTPAILAELRKAMTDDLVIFEYQVDNSTGMGTSFRVDEKGSSLLEKKLKKLMEIQQ